MNLTELSSAICPTLDGPVLTVLAGTTRPLTGREVARLVRRGSWPGVRRVLHRLAAHGIVDVQEAGPSLLYTLNRRHLAAPAVATLADLHGELVRRLRQRIERWDVPVVHASLFGSAARRDGDTASDIDVFVVRPRQANDDDVTWRAQLETLAADVFAWTGNHAGIAEVSEEDVDGMRRDRPAIVEQLLVDAILLAGRPLTCLVGGVA